MQAQDKYISPSLKHTARFEGLFEGHTNYKHYVTIY